MMRYIIFWLKTLSSSTLILTLLLSQDVLGTTPTSKDSLSTFKLKQYERTKLRADKYFGSFSYVKGIEVYKKALNILPSDDTIKLRIAESFYLVHNLDSAQHWYDKVMTNEDILSDDIHYWNYGELMASSGQYVKAKFWFEKFQQKNPEDYSVQERLAGLERILSFYKDSLRFEISHAPFNSDTYDFSPSYYDDQILFVSARETEKAIQFLKPKYKWDKTYFLNLFKVDSASNVEIFDKRIRSSYHEGPVTFYDNETKVLFTRNNFKKSEIRFNKKKLIMHGAETNESKEGINKLKLFLAEKDEEGIWSTPVELWFNSHEFSTGHPTVSTDGQRLYFASDRPGGHGKTDIYRSIWRNGIWGEPENMGDIINTEGEEMFPYVDENDILYYSSDGHEGLGGLDIFKVDLNELDAKPKNIGYPLNSSRDDFGIIIKNSGTNQSGYFSSNRYGGLGSDDIYAFNYEGSKSIPGKVVDLITGAPIDSANVSSLDGNGNAFSQMVTKSDGSFRIEFDWEDNYLVKANKHTYTRDSIGFDPSDYGPGDTIILRIAKEILVVKGTITDEIKNDTLESVKIIVTNENTGDKFGMITKTDGAYSFIGSANTKYSFTLKKHRYFTRNNTLSTGPKRSGEIIHDGKLEEIVIGKPIELNDIHFDLAKWDIREDAANELQKFTAQLNDNPSIIVELSTHTDCRGSDSYNLSLSDKRAKSSAQYVIEQGISSARLVGKGYGETKLLNECDDGVKCTEEQHQSNRRAEFKVTGFLQEEESEEEKTLLWIDPNYLSAAISTQDKDKIVLVNENTGGTVTLRGTVVDAEGNPLNRVLISMMDNNTKKAQQTYTNEGGMFEFSVHPENTYRIVAQIEGFHEEGVEVEVKSEDKNDLSLQLARNE